MYSTTPHQWFRSDILIDFLYTVLYSLTTVKFEMRVFYSLGVLLSTWSCLAAAFTNPIKNGSDPQIAYYDGM